MELVRDCTYYFLTQKICCHILSKVYHDKPAS